MSGCALETYYVRYLKEIRRVKNSTVNHYRDALKYISNYLVGNGKIQKSIFEIQDIDSLDSLKFFYTVTRTFFMFSSTTR